jgi:hypothetical protein
MFSDGHAKFIVPGQWVGPTYGVFYYWFCRGGSALTGTPKG